MATNKNAILRYQVLDRCFRNPGRKYFIEDLVEACNKAILDLNPNAEGIKKRQVQYDIRFMESEAGYSVPLQRMKEGKRSYYRYEDTGFSINNQPLNEIEAEHLRSALSVIARFKGIEQFEWINEVIPNLEQSFNLKPDQEKVIDFEQNQYLQGKEHLWDLFNAIYYKKVLKTTYHSFKHEEPAKFIIHPYYLKQYNNRWFLFGQNHELRRISNLPLDRIISFQEEKIKYLENKDFDFEDYFEDLIGVTKPEEAKFEKIILKFLPEQAPYILTKPLHGSQKIIEQNENGLTLSIEVFPNFELESIVLSFGEKVEVIAPKHFRRHIKERLEKSRKLY